MLICPEFPPEPSSSGIMAEQLSTRLATAGYDVTVLTAFPNRPAGRTYDGYRRRLRSVEQHGAVRIVRCANWLIGSQRRHIDRILENVTFGLTSFWNALREPAPDLIIVETWPILAVQANFWLGQIRRAPLFYYVKDVYPEIAVDVGVMSAKGVMAKLLLAWDARLCRRSNAVIAISETMKRLLCSTRRTPESRVHVVNDWVDCNAITPLPRLNSWRSSFGIAEDSFLLTYAGILGLVSGVDILIEVARQLKSSNVLILCVGEGPLKAKMVSAAAEESLVNIRFLEFQKQKDLPEMLAAADAFFLPMRPHTRDASVPSKLISYLAAGRPVICASPHESAVLDVVRDGNAGIVVEPGDAGAITEAVQELVHNPTVAGELGRNARRTFEEHFTFEQAYGRFEHLISTQLRDSGSCRVRDIPEAQEPVIEAMGIHDVPGVTTLHMRALQGFFTARMGRGFLATFYRHFCLDSRCVARVLKVQGEVIGHFVASSAPRVTYRSLALRSGLRLAMEAIAACGASPSLLLELIRRPLAYLRRGAALPDEGPLLMSICVSPAVQGLGYGERLIRALVEEAQQKHWPSLTAYTDADSNGRVIEFYEGLGFRNMGTFMALKGRRMVHLRLPVTDTGE